MKMLAGRLIIPTTPAIKAPTKIPELEMEFPVSEGRRLVYWAGSQVRTLILTIAH